ncbi:uncharacterized protein LOC131330008 [Rhododendron vialii]|uniref:uncharacterized protein LOC131330008 n=1 Tax=Rhododendron vialii TaxID=182163 RepID=UPI00265E9218|nr:uncharacterized protein LOC131330008 [Rhododendron vialii]
MTRCSACTLDEQVYDDLAKHKPSSMKELMTRIKGWCQLIESKSERGIGKPTSTKVTIVSVAVPTATLAPTPKKQVNNIKLSSKRGPKPSDFNAKKIVFTVPIYWIIDQVKDQPFFSFPNQKLGIEKGKTKNPIIRCSYHNEQGHFTTACKPFKAYLEQLVTGGHLDNPIDHDKTRAWAQHVKAQSEEEIQTIHVIHGPLNAEATCDIRAELNDASSSKHVMLVGLKPKCARTEDVSMWIISFTKKDLDSVQLPHNDALVVTLHIGTFNVWRVLVDQGSSAEVMYYSLFKDLKLSENDLRPSVVPLIGFNRAPVWPIGMITLLVRVGSVTHDMEFVVVDVPSPYNAIVGCTWLYKMKAIASTYHQVVRFIGAYGRQDDLYGDQTAAKRCYVNAIRSSKQTSRVNLIEVPDAPILEHVGRRADEKAIEDLVTIPINEVGSHFFLVGSSLSDTKRNIEVFASTIYEMPGIDPSFICHELNIDRSKRSVVQWARRSSRIHSEAVIKEVN